MKIAKFSEINEGSFVGNAYYVMVKNIGDDVIAQINTMDMDNWSSKSDGLDQLLKDVSNYVKKQLI